MSTPSQTDWAIDKAEEILGYLPLERMVTLVPQVAAALRAERERCAQVAESLGSQAMGQAGDYMRAVGHTVAAEIREGA